MAFDVYLCGQIRLRWIRYANKVIRETTDEVRGYFVEIACDSKLKQLLRVAGLDLKRIMQQLRNWNETKYCKERHWICNKSHYETRHFIL